LGVKPPHQSRRALTPQSRARPYPPPRSGRRWLAPMARVGEGSDLTSKHLLATRPAHPAKAGTSGGTAPSPIPTFGGGVRTKEAIPQTRRYLRKQVPSPSKMLTRIWTLCFRRGLQRIQPKNRPPTKARPATAAA
jgi:hypothetical protein